MVSCQDDGSPAGLETPDRFTELADRKKEIWYQVVVGQLPFPLQHHKLVVNPKCSRRKKEEQIEGYYVQELKEKSKNYHFTKNLRCVISIFLGKNKHIFKK